MLEGAAGGDLGNQTRHTVHDTTPLLPAPQPCQEDLGATLTSGLPPWGIWRLPAAPSLCTCLSGPPAVCGGGSWHHMETVPFEA